jgi:hypothetical protein
LLNRDSSRTRSRGNNTSVPGVGVEEVEAEVEGTEEVEVEDMVV